MRKELVFLGLALSLLLVGGASAQMSQRFLGTAPAQGRVASGNLQVTFEIGGVASLGLRSANGALELRPAALTLGQRSPVSAEQLRPLRVQPNPASDWAEASWEAGALAEDGSLTLLNVLGQPVRRIHVPAGALSARCPVGGLPRGLYLARLTDAAGRTVGAARLIVSR